MVKKTDIGNTLRDISHESRLLNAEKVSLKNIAEEFDILQAENDIMKKLIASATCLRKLKQALLSMPTSL